MLPCCLDSSHMHAHGEGMTNLFRTNEYKGYPEECWRSILSKMELKCMKRDKMLFLMLSNFGLFECLCFLRCFCINTCKYSCMEPYACTTYFYMVLYVSRSLLDHAFSEGLRQWIPKKLRVAIQFLLPFPVSSPQLLELGYRKSWRKPFSGSSLNFTP